MGHPIIGGGAKVEEPDRRWFAFVGAFVHTQTYGIC